MPIAIVTGGGSGMGAALARHLVDKDAGWHVVLADVNVAGGEAVAAGLGAHGEFIRTDVSDWESIRACFARVWERHRRIDFVAANAGIVDTFDFAATPSTPLPASPPPDLRCLNVDLLGPIYSAYLAIHYFALSPPSALRVFTATSSQTGLYGFAGVPLYCAAKHRVIGMVRSLGKDPVLAARGMRFAAICPGMVMTPLVPAEAEAVAVGAVTPMSTILRGYDRVLEGGATGEVLECSLGEVHVREEHQQMDGAIDIYLPGLAKLSRRQIPEKAPRASKL